MDVLAMLLLVVGGIVSLIGGIWLIVLAFKESILWGLGSIFIPFVSLIFAVMHWDKAGKPFLIALLGGILSSVGYMMSSGF